MTPAGFPHSDIPGSKPACGSPRLFAAYHVLLRLSAPRHPPCTLSSLTKLECFSQANLIALTRFSCQRSRGRSLLWIAEIRIFEPVGIENAQPSDAVPKRPGGADRVRTDDFRLAKAALSQLSYSPSRNAAPNGSPDKDLGGPR